MRELGQYSSLTGREVCFPLKLRTLIIPTQRKMS